MLNGLEEFLSFQPGLSIVGYCFHLVEELLFHRQSFISAKKYKDIFLFFLQIKMNLNLTFLTSKNYEKILTLNLC